MDISLLRISMKLPRKHKKEKDSQRTLIEQELDSLTSVITEIVRNAPFLETTLLQ